MAALAVHVEFVFVEFVSFLAFESIRVVLLPLELFDSHIKAVAQTDGGFGD